MSASSEKGKRLEELAREYKTVKGNLERAHKEYEEISEELEKEGIIPARLKTEQKEAKTFEDIVKNDPDLYELNNEHAVFLFNKKNIDEKNLAAFQLERNGNFIFTGIEVGYKSIANKNRWRYTLGIQDAEWFQEKLELARRYNKILEEKKR